MWPFPSPDLTRIAAVALTGLALTIAGCGPATPTSEAPTAPSATGGHVVSLRTIADMKPVAGEVTTRDMGMATARIGGTLVRLNVREGATVRAGQVIGPPRAIWRRREPRGPPAPSPGPRGPSWPRRPDGC